MKINEASAFLLAAIGLVGLYASPWLETSSASLVRLGLLSPFRKSPPRLSTQPVSILVVLPAYREKAETLLKCLSSLDERSAHPNRVRVVISNGGNPGDEEIARVVKDFKPRRLTSPLRVVHMDAPLGRGPTQNLGARATPAAGDDEVLLFCHADVVMPVGFDEEIDEHFVYCQNPPLVLAFKFKINALNDRNDFSFVERTTNWRSRRLEFPYGDQSLCVRRSDFEELGGFPEMKIMEDFEFIKRARKLAWSRGTRIATSDSPALADSRRWETKGVLKTTAWNWWICFSYTWVGVKPDTIFRWYYG